MTERNLSMIYIKAVHLVFGFILGVIYMEIVEPTPKQPTEQAIILPEQSATIEYDTSILGIPNFKDQRIKVKDSDSTYHYIYY